MSRGEEDDVQNYDVQTDDVEEEDDETEDADAEEEGRSQDRARLCEPAMSKYTSTCHKSHFIRKFAGKNARPSLSSMIKHRPLHLP